MASGQAREITPERRGRLRKARTGDVLAMQRLINDFADRHLMLHRSLSELYENVRDFFVVEEDGEIVGCAGLHISWKDLAELKSLAVAESCQGRGYGRWLVQACVDEAEEIGLERVFALTYVPELFRKLDFDVVDRAVLPRKVWTECIRCPKFANCGEIAVQRWVGAIGEGQSIAPKFMLELTPVGAAR